MYQKNRFILILAAVGLLLAASSCKKTGYLTDTGIHDAVTPLSNYDYLAKNQFKQFDTLLLIIDRFPGLKEEMNKAGTFFAPTDFSILRTLNARLTAKQQINPSNTYTLDSLVKAITADSLRQYMFKEKITLDNAPELQAAPYTSLGNTTQGALKVLQTGTPYVGSRTTAATYLLFFVKVRGALDVPGVTPPATEVDISALCQTTGILTSNGATVLHVIANTHSFSTF
jgi:hypothetical protein